MFRIRSALSETAFCYRNLRAFKHVSSFESVRDQGFLYRGCRKTDLGRIGEIFWKLNNGARFSVFRRLLYGVIGPRALLVVEKDGASCSDVLGFNMYYVNPRDVRDGTVHEAFIGVLPEASGRGLASMMRSIAVSHYRTFGFNGISTRISLSNASSLRSAERTGFVPVERYMDSRTNEERYYMVRRFLDE